MMMAERKLGLVHFQFFSGKLVPFLEQSAAHASILTMLVISVERYYAICRPLRANSVWTRRRGAALIGLLWCLAAALTSPVLVTTVLLRDVPHNDGSLVETCVTHASGPWRQAFFLGSSLVLFWLPLVVLVVLYTLIVRNLVCSKRVSRSSSQEKSRRKVVFMLACVVIFFFACLMPFRIFSLWLVLASDEELQNLGMEAYYNLLYFCRVMLYIDAALNPVFYAAVSSKFRTGCVRLICCRGSRRTKVVLFYSSLRSRSSNGHNHNHLELLCKAQSIV